MEKKLYPLKFIPVASPRPWGGTALYQKLGKRFVCENGNGQEEALPADAILGESWELADMGTPDSVVENGWLAGNTIGDLMQIYMERVVGDKVFNAYGTQFPLLVKFLDIHEKLSVQVHTDDEIAAQRYDCLGKSEIWYVLEAQPEAKVYLGFNRPVSASEFYDACKAGTADKLLNVIHPQKGDVFRVRPGTVHSADAGVLIYEVQESSDLTFRLYDWGRENNPATARKMHLEEAIDLIDFGKFDPNYHIKAASYLPTRHETAVKQLVNCPQFTISHLTLFDGMRVCTEKMDGFVVYSCVKGEVSLQMPDENGVTRDYRLHLGDTILVPAECPDYVLSPVEPGSVLIESTTHPDEPKDSYFDGEEKPEA